MIKCALQYFLEIYLINSNQMLVLDESGKPEFRERNLSEQSRVNQQTLSIHVCPRARESNPGHIGGRQVLSPMCQPCTPKVNKKQHLHRGGEIGGLCNVN